MFCRPPVAEVWINPLDAQKRGIANGDRVRVFNDRGEVRLPAKVTPRILPGVSAMGQGAWHNADMAGDKIDHGACINTLTTLRPSPAKGNPQHTNLVEIEKSKPPAPGRFTRPELLFCEHNDI